MHLAFLIAFRARPPQEFRRAELDGLIENIRRTMRHNPGLTYRIWIGEQDDDRPFNKGWLYNAIWNEAMLSESDATFVHCNTDYRMPEAPFPPELCQPPDGFLELHGFAHGDTMGAFCAFRAEAYRASNGFPNNLWGWGGDDWALTKRARLAEVPIVRPPHLFNHWLTEDVSYHAANDESANARNTSAALSVDRETMMLDGANTAAYWISRSVDDDDLSWRCFQQARRIVVTGGAGRFGMRLVDELCRTRNPVTVIDSLVTGRPDRINPAANLLIADVRATPVIEPYLVGAKGLFHAATMTDPDACLRTPVLAWETNVLGTVSVCEAARLAGVPAVVVCSPDVRNAPVSPLRASLRAAQGVIATYRANYGVNVSIVHPPDFDVRSAAYSDVVSGQGTPPSAPAGSGRATNDSPPSTTIVDAAVAAALGAMRDSAP